MEKVKSERAADRVNFQGNSISGVRWVGWQFRYVYIHLLKLLLRNSIFDRQLGWFIELSVFFGENGETGVGDLSGQTKCTLRYQGSASEEVLNYTCAKFISMPSLWATFDVTVDASYLPLNHLPSHLLALRVCLFAKG